jgi:tRNA threonylcarbamoyladenosine biosynthesis protein TsaE
MERHAAPSFNLILQYPANSSSNHVLCPSLMTISPVQKFHCMTADDTSELAGRVAGVLRGGDYVSLEGDLGAGKTHFTRALAKALGVKGTVTSPTFVLQKNYALPKHPTLRGIAHYDFYRISDYSELLDMGFEDHDSTTLVLAEWGDLFISEFPVKPIRINFETNSDDSRLILISGLNFPVPSH